MANQATTVYELRDTGDPANGGGFAWTLLGKKTSYKWTLSASGTGEYYCEALAGGDPSIASVASLFLDRKHNLATQGTVGSLTASQWDYGDNDTLGYSTPYVRLADDTDPDTKGPYFVGVGMGGGQDYSQQAAAQLSLADLTTDGAGTTLSSVTGGFTALMVYNIIYIASGTGFNAGWYTIVTYTDTNNVVLDRSAGSSATAGAGKVGGAISNLTSTFANQFVSSTSISNKCYIAYGTYVHTANFDMTTSGDLGGPIKFTGYKTTRGDNPTLESNLPIISGGAYSTKWSGDFYEISGIKFTATSASSFALSLSSSRASRLINCVGVSANATGISSSTSAIIPPYIENCRGEGLTYGLISGNDNVFYSSFKGGTRGVIHTSSSLTNCIIYDSPVGIRIGSTIGRIKNCTIDNCPTYGIDTNGLAGIDITENIISNCGTGIMSTNVNYVFDELSRANRNAYFGNTTDLDGATHGDDDVIGLDPEYVGSGDYNTGANMLVTKVSIDGLTTTQIRLGAIENNDSAGGGGGGSFGYVS